jgi:hypothetical protein
VLHPYGVAPYGVAPLPCMGVVSEASIGLVFETNWPRLLDKRGELPSLSFIADVSDRRRYLDDVGDPHVVHGIVLRAFHEVRFFDFCEALKKAVACLIKGTGGMHLATALDRYPRSCCMEEGRTEER